MNGQPFLLWIEAEEWPAGEWEPADSVTDVVVTLADGTRLVASFCTFAHLGTLRRNCAESGECLGGRYLWGSDLVLVDDTSRATVEAVVGDLIASGDLESAFSPVEETDGDGQLD
ncbi:MAG TPA: hypothetical protein VFX39_10200 [Gemmatimonadaceae bacterium]|nr:hypothetical protein [Gemmatimonadaceae bacterium]